MLCTYTNDYAETIGPQKPSLYQSWNNTYPEEFYRFIGLFIYMSIVQARNIEKYWSKKSLYRGMWARSFMVKKRFKQLMSVLKISNGHTEDPDDKRSKAGFLMEFMRRKYPKLFQPFQNVCINEHMVRNKGRCSFRQCIRDKPT